MLEMRIDHGGPCRLAVMSYMKYLSVFGNAKAIQRYARMSSQENRRFLVCRVIFEILEETAQKSGMKIIFKLFKRESATRLRSILDMRDDQQIEKHQNNGF